MEHRSSALLRIAVPLKGLVQRFMYLGLIVATFCLMLLGKIDAVLIDRLRAGVTNAAAPILAALSQPIATISEGVNTLRELGSIREENLRLAQENANLKQWLSVARRLQAENTALQALLNSVDDPKPKFVAARVIAGAMGPFSNTLIINAGWQDGVKDGQAVLGDQGFVGRISQVANHSARILMATDINSRIPVILESTRTRAVMAGGNTRRPRLIHLPPAARVIPSERVGTSGHGGVFPPGLPVGSVATVSDSGIEVLLFTNYHQLEFVRVTDFGLTGLVDTTSLRKRIRGITSKGK